MGVHKDPKVTKLRAEAQRFYADGMSIRTIAETLGIKYYIARDYVLLKEAQKAHKPRKLGTCKCGRPACIRYKKEIMCRECMIGDEEEPRLEDYMPNGRYKLGARVRP